MTDLYLLHIHNSENDVYCVYDTVKEALDGVIEYVEGWWEKEIPSEPLFSPLAQDDIDYYFSETGGWYNIVHIFMVGFELTTEVIDPTEIWK